MSDFLEKARKIREIKLPKGSTTFTGGMMLEKHGGDMWEKLKEWLQHEWDRADIGDYTYHISIIQDQMKAIEKQYGVDYVE